jgi:hypothetical protein
VFIHPGKTVNIEIPVYNNVDYYEIKYATGTTWCGYDDDQFFGPEMKTFTCKDKFYFSANSGYELELIKQVGGNLATEEIDSDTF